MPPLKDKLAAGTNLRAMFNGEAMRKKSTFAVQAAEAGFNVIYVDGDGNSQVLNQLSSAAKDRVFYVDAIDTPDNSAMGWFIIRLLSGDDFIWDEQAKLLNNVPTLGDKSHSFIKFEYKKLTKNDFIIIDSWTAFVRSLQRRYCQENNIIIEEKTVMDGDWSDYRWTGAIADKMLENLKLLPCHSVTIAHLDRLEKKDKKGNVLSVKYRPTSTSRAQADKMPKYFTDILSFEMTGSQLWISGKTTDEYTSGSRSIPPFREKYDEFSFQKLIDAMNVKPTGAPCEALTFIAPRELAKPITNLPASDKVAPVAVIEATPKSTPLLKFNLKK